MSVKFYDINHHCELKYAVIAAFYEGKYVFVRHRERDTLETPGGHHEFGATIEQTARRELYEETGAEEFTLTPVCVYSFSDYGMLFYAEIDKFGEMPDSEIAEVKLLNSLPDNWTYPDIQPYLIKRAIEFRYKLSY